MRVILVIMTGVFVGLGFGFFLGYQQAKEYPYSWEQEQKAVAASKQNAEDTKNNAAPELIKGQLYPKLVIDDETYNFGVFEKEQKGEHAFTVKNEGDAALALTFLDKACFCTDVAPLHLNVLPGKEAQVTVQWKPNIASGAYSQGVLFKTNDPKKPQLYLSIKGVYSAPIIVIPNPVSINAFSSKTVSTKFRMYSFEKKPVTVLGVESDDPHFEAELTKSELTKEENDHKLFNSATSVYDGVVTLKPGLPLGHFQNKLTIRSDSELDPAFELPLKGQIFGNTSIICSDYDQATGVLNMGRTTRGTPVTKTLMLRFTPQGTQMPTFRVTEVKPSWLKVTIGEIKGEAGESRLLPITVEIPKDANLGNSVASDPENMAEIKIESDFADAAVIRIPVVYSVNAPAQ
ncbi:MAG: DUF1573 domain-containing protein [Planctomycetaceae bacterium]|nr:DUF1573 domain-containing protein [Planctomycetaceae bacterium]